MVLNGPTHHVMNCGFAMGSALSVASRRANVRKARLGARQQFLPQPTISLRSEWNDSGGPNFYAAFKPSQPVSVCAVVIKVGGGVVTDSSTHVTFTFSNAQGPPFSASPSSVSP